MRYSGLIGFFISLISVLTGLVFVLIVTRRLTPEEFGTWSLLWGIVGYFLISERVISFWTTRQIARDENVGKTSVASSSIFSIGAIPLYISLVFLMSHQSNVNLDAMLLGSILLPIVFVSETLQSINLAHKPHTTSYGLMGYEGFKIPAALAFVYFLELGVEGAVLAITFAYAGRIIIQLYYAKSKLHGKFKKKYLKRWLKLSWISFYSNISKFFKSTDIIIYPLITGSVIGIAYYSASLVVARVIRHSGNISKALYPKLLANGSQNHIGETLSLQLYFAIPMLGIFIIFAKPAMFTLNPHYIDAYTIVIILSLRIFLAELTGFFQRVLKGIDKVDYDDHPTFSNLIKSKIFYVYTKQNIHNGLQLGILIGLLFTLTWHGSSELEIVTWWAMVSLILEIPFLILMAIQAKKHTKFSIPFKSILKYSCVTLIFVGIFYLTNSYLIVYEISIFKFLPGLIIQLAICIAIYLGVTFIIDKKIRKIAKSVIAELKSKI